jgi:hydrogenase expression/formation protein HypC
MCLAIPGQLTSIINANDPLARKGKVEFSGVSKEVSLAYVPEAKISDYVLIHAGFAISIVDEEDAKASLRAFDDLSAFANPL